MSTPHVLEGLRGMRRHRKMTIKETGELIGVQANTYVRYENGTRRMYFDYVCRLADVMRCTIDDLRYYRNEDELFTLYGLARRLDGTDAAPPSPQNNLNNDIVVVGSPHTPASDTEAEIDALIAGFDAAVPANGPPATATPHQAILTPGLPRNALSDALAAPEGHNHAFEGEIE